MDEYVKEHGFAGWFETSAKENINIEEAARALVNKVKIYFFHLIINIWFPLTNQIMFFLYMQILLNDKIINAGEILDGDKFNLDGSSTEHHKKSCSCWRFIYSLKTFLI